MTADIGTRVVATILAVLTGAGLSAWLHAPWYGTFAITMLAYSLILIAVSIPRT